MIMYVNNYPEWDLIGYTCRSRLVSYGQVGDWYEVSYYVAFQRWFFDLSFPSCNITQ